MRYPNVPPPVGHNLVSRCIANPLFHRRAEAAKFSVAIPYLPARWRQYSSNTATRTETGASTDQRRAVSKIRKALETHRRAIGQTPISHAKGDAASYKVLFS